MRGKVVKLTYEMNQFYNNIFGSYTYKKSIFVTIWLIFIQKLKC